MLLCVARRAITAGNSHLHRTGTSVSNVSLTMSKLVQPLKSVPGMPHKAYSTAPLKRLTLNNSNGHHRSTRLYSHNHFNKNSGMPEGYHPKVYSPHHYHRLRYLALQAAAQQTNNTDYHNAATSSASARHQLLRKIMLTVGGAAVLFTSTVYPLPASAYTTTNPNNTTNNTPAIVLTSMPSPPTTTETKTASPNSPAAVKASPAFLESKQSMPSSADLSPEELATVRLFQENTASVVNIANIVQATNRFSMDVMSIPQGQGSGFIWDDQGHIVTNFHVIRGASEVRVSLIDQSTFPAKFVGGDASKDIAILQLEAPKDILKNLKPVSLGQSSALFVGQKVFAIGNPFGLDHTLTSGIVSGLNRTLSTGNGSLRNCIQTDASINPGNSGGPLLDSRGRLIGINTAIADPSGKGASSGVGFAIPIDTVRGLVDQILKYGRVVRPVLGVTIGPPQALRQIGLEGGVLVLDVAPGSPAGKAGMQGLSRDRYGRLVIGDVIVGIKGQPVKKESDLFDILDDCKVGEKIDVQVLRQGEQQVTLQVVLAERSPDKMGQ